MMIIMIINMRTKRQRVDILMGTAITVTVMKT